MALTRLGRYELVAPLGRGGMAEVWRAKARGAARFSRDVAVKVMLPEFAADADLVKMFVDEACVAAKLEHPNIVQTHDFGRAGDRYFIVLELIDGVALRALPRDEPLSMHEAVHVVAEIAHALDYAYDAPGEDGAPLRLVHRDVNPSNIMLTVRGAVKLADFGIAKTRMSSVLTTAGSLKGKLPYMSPEQAVGGAVDGRSDVYALGLTLYELLHGQRAIRGTNEIEVLEAARRGGVPRLAGSVPAALADVVARALEVDPAARFASAGDLRRALLPLLEGASTTALEARLAERVVAVVAASRSDEPLASEHPSDSRDEEGTEPATVGPPGARSGTVAVAPPVRPRLMLARWLTAGGLLVALAGGAAVVRARHATPVTPVLPSPAPSQPRDNPTPHAEVPAVSAPIAQPTPAPVHVARARPASTGPATLRIQARPWAEISVDGKDVGMTPLHPLELDPGRHRIVAVNPELGTKRVTLELRGGEQRLVQIGFEGAGASR